MDGSQINPVQPDINIVRAFVAAYFGDANARFRVSLLPFCPNLPKKDREAKDEAGNPLYPHAAQPLRTHEMSGTIGELWSSIGAAAAMGYSAYLFPNEISAEIDHPFAKDSDIVRVRSHHVDCDAGLPGRCQKPGAPNTWHLPPSLMVHSSSVVDVDGHIVEKGQAYWLVADDVPLDEYQAGQQQLIARYQSDPQVCDLKRIMRLPGSIHRKTAVSRQEMQELQRRGEPVPLTDPQVVTFEGDGKRYQRAEVLAGLPPLAEKPKKERQTKERQQHEPKPADSEHELPRIEAALADLAETSSATGRLDLTSNPHGGWWPIVRAWGNTKFAGWDDPEGGLDIQRRAREGLRKWMDGEWFKRAYTEAEKKHFKGAFRAEWEDDYESAWKGDYAFGTIVARARAEGAREQRAFTMPGAEPKGNPRINFMTVYDVDATDDPEDLVKGLISRGENAAFIAEPKVGKTFLALDVGLSVVAGLPVLGHYEVTHSGPVVYLSGEGHGGMKKRLRAWRKHRGVTIDQTRTFFYNRGVPLAQGNTPEALEFVDAIRARAGDDAILIVIDTLSRSLAGLNENEAGAINQYLDVADAIRRHCGPNCTTLTLAHSSNKDPKKPTDFRGSSAAAAGFDSAHTIDWCKDNETLELKSKYLKDADEDERPPVYFKRVKVDNSAVLVKVEKPKEDAAANASREVLIGRMIALGMIDAENALTTREFAEKLAGGTPNSMRANAADRVEWNKRVNQWKSHLENGAREKRGRGKGGATYDGLFEDEGIEKSRLRAATEKAMAKRSSKTTRVWFLPAEMLDAL
jgi:hypothetical protein